MFWNETVEKLVRIFENSNYPRRFVNNRIWNAKRRLNVLSEREKNGEEWIVSSAIGTTDFDPLAMMERKSVAACKVGHGVENATFISFPQCNDVIRRSNALVKKTNLPKRIVLSGRVTKSVRNSIFTNLKSKKEFYSIVNASALITCKHCPFECKVKTDYLDLERTVRHLKRNTNSMIGKHLVQFPDHCMNGALRDVRQFKSKHECSLVE